MYWVQVYSRIVPIINKKKNVKPTATLPALSPTLYYLADWCLIVFMCLCEHIFSLVHLLSFLSPSLGDGPIYAEILSQRAVKLKTINRPTLLICIEVGQDLMRLAVGAGVCCLDITIRSLFLWQTTQYKLKYCLKGPLNPYQPANQSINQFSLNFKDES